eukprot:1136793_1
MSKKQWKIFVRKAKYFQTTEHVLAMKCVRLRTAKCYGMKYGDKMSYKHIIAMMIYCNSDELQYRFSETYRKIAKNETFIELKNRHRNYFFLGKYLRECTECFGMPDSDSTL